MNQRKAFTLIELLVVISIIALLIAILMPALSKSQEQARRTQCGMQLKGSGTMLTAWASDYDDILPEGNASLARGAGIDLTFDARNGAAMGLAMPIVEGYDRDPRALYCPTWSHPTIQYGESGPDPGGYVPGLYGGWPAGGEDEMAGFFVIGISYHYRATFGKLANEPANLSAPRFTSDTTLTADHWTRREGLLGVLYGHGDAYNTLYADMHVELLAISEDDMETENKGRFTNGSWARQERIWESLFESD